MQRKVMTTAVLVNGKWQELPWYREYLQMKKVCEAVKSSIDNGRLLVQTDSNIYCEVLKLRALQWE